VTSYNQRLALQRAKLTLMGPPKPTEDVATRLRRKAIEERIEELRELALTETRLPYAED